MADITIIRGDTLELAFENLGDLTDYEKIWFTVKANAGDPADAESAIQVTKEPGSVDTDGLRVVEGAAPNSAENGVITIDDTTDGDITVRIEAEETAKLTVSNSCRYDVQVRFTDGEVTTVTSGDAAVTEDVSRSVT